MVKMTEDELIGHALSMKSLLELGKFKAALPRASYGVFRDNHERDLILVTKNNYVYEYEMKSSRSDFLADFKKPKHGKKSNVIKRFTYIVAPNVYKEGDELPHGAGLIELYQTKNGNYKYKTLFEPLDNESANPLTEKQVMQIYRLCTFRIVSLYRKGLIR